MGGGVSHLALALALLELLVGLGWAKLRETVVRCCL